MELRDEIAGIIADCFDDYHLACIPAGRAAELILAIPEIEIALSFYAMNVAAGDDDETGAAP